MRKKTLRRSFCVLIAAAIAASFHMSDAAGGLAKSELFYVVMAHPDDEPGAWSIVESRPTSTYTVFVTMTRGESTISCQTAAQGRNRAMLGQDAVLVEGFATVVQSDQKTGPYKYQGPDSPVGEPDKGERHPYGDPWQGQGSDACADARIASWNWFLDDMHALDGSGTNMAMGDNPWTDDDYQGEFCRARRTSDRNAPRMLCADVWANDEGARVSFDLPNAMYHIDPETDEGIVDPSEFGVEDVTAALRTLRGNRAKWGIPGLPEAGMVAAQPHASHPEHTVVADALYQVDYDAGPQLGASRPNDPYFQQADKVVQPQNWTTTVAYNFIDPVTEERIGPSVVNYGWVEPTYSFWSSADVYWRRFA